MLSGLLILLLGQFAGSGIIPTATKVGVAYFPPLIFVFLRFFVAAIIFFPVFYFSKRQKLAGKDYRKIMVLAFFLFSNVTLFTIAIPYTTVLMSQILYTATPIVVGVLGHWFFNERLTKHKVIGLAIALAGVCFLLLQSASKEGHLTFGTPLGNVLILVAMFGYSGYILYARKLSDNKKYTSTQLSFYTFLFIGLYLFVINCFHVIAVPLSVGGVPVAGVPVAGVPVAGVLSVMWVGVGNVISYALLQLGIKKTNAFTASLFQYLGPFLSGVVAIPLLHEKLTIELIIGGIVIIAGVFYATSYDRLKRRLVQ